MTHTMDAEDLIGAVVLGRADDRIGEVRQVLASDDPAQPAWVVVRLGSPHAEVLVPLRDADWDDTVLHASVSGDDARTAPPMDLDEPLSLQEEERLLRHYGIPCVCTPRQSVDLEALADGADSYSIGAPARE